MKTLAIFVSCYALSTCAQQLSDALVARADLSLTTDRSAYYVGEPVQLRLAVANTDDVPLFGHVLLAPYLPDELKSSALNYCREGGPCEESSYNPKLWTGARVKKAAYPSV